jgi:transaldolase
MHHGTRDANGSPIRRTIELGADFWNDSCDLAELREAVDVGAVGATSNPVIVSQVVRSDPGHWQPVLDRLIAAEPTASEDLIAWSLVEMVAREAASLLAPVHQATEGRKGFLSVQVNPQLYRSADRMVEHARRLSALAPNIAIKIPATAAGLEAMEKLTGEGIRINATVCFTLSQAIACAEAVERGFARAATLGTDTRTLHPTVTLMVGRLDDHLQRLLERDAVTIDPGFLHWAGVAVFKKAHALFTGRGYRSTLLAAAYRHHLHWTELIGERVVLTMPYKWWRQFEGSKLVPERTVARPVAPEVLGALSNGFEDFRAAYEEHGLEPAQFTRYGASVHTLQQFLAGYQSLLELVRIRMLA